MNPLVFDPAFVQRVAGALLHFIWQGAAIAAVTAVCLRLLARTSAEKRYVVSVFGLACMPVAPVLTLLLYDRMGRAVFETLALVSGREIPGAVAASPMLMYWIVGLWSAGVFGCMGRLALAWRFSRRLVRVATSEAPLEVASLFEQAAALLGIDIARKKIRILISGALDSPAVVGWIRPVVLVPVSTLTGLSTDQLTAVLAHELAHIRRHDFLVNTLQTLVESLLFYHPAVWWLSGRVRAEREHCCDDLAVRACGDRRLYVGALVDLERRRHRLEYPAVSAAGGSLKERVQRLLGSEARTADWRSLLVTCAFVCVWMAAGLSQPGPPGAFGNGPQLRPPAQFAATIPALTPAGAAAAMSTVAAIATAQPIVPEAQLPGEPGTLTGILRASTGVPLEGIRMAASPVDQSIAFTELERRGLTALTDRDGRYRLSGILPGRYYILVGYNGPRFYYSGVADAGRAQAIQLSAGATLEVPDTVVTGGTVTGRIIDSTSPRTRFKNLVLCCDYFKPLLGVQDLSGDSIPRRGYPFMPTVSEDGSFSFSFVPSGNYVFSVGDERFISGSWVIAVGPDGANGLQLEIPEVPEGSGVQGIVVDQTGRTVPAEVQLLPEPAKPMLNTGPPMNTGGSFILSGDPVIFATGTGGLFIPRVDPSLEEVQDRMAEAARKQSRTATAGPDGRFEFQRVPPGAYVLQVISGGFTLPSQNIQVGAGGLTNVRFQVPATHVAGRVLAADGGPLPKLDYIRLVRAGSENDVFYGFPDTEGNFSLLLLPGRYRVFTERLGPRVKSVSDGSQDITNTEASFDGAGNPRIVVTLEP